MASRSEKCASEPQGLQPNDQDEKYADESSAPSAQPSPPNEAEDSLSNNEETTYPEGGFQACWTSFLRAEIKTEIGTDYYQIILAFSLLTGAGTSLIMNPAVTSVAHWFNERRGLASGIAWTGSGIGGVIFPLMVQSLLPQVGWAWSLRAFALILFVLCTVSVALCRSRVPPRNGDATTWRDTIPSARIFLDGTGAMALTTAGAVLTDLAYFIPVTYIPSYYVARQHLPHHTTLTGEASFAYQLLAILNGSSCVGRLLAGYVSDRLGRYNTMILSLFLCAISVLCFWLPDILIPNMPNTGLLIVFVMLFGCVSGSNVSLMPVCMGQLCETQEFGRYYATCFSVVSFGALVSIPIAGALIDAVDAPGKTKFWGVAVFTGLCYVAATLCFAWVRLRVKGLNWKTRW
ncbi:MAG: hypothetical protein Q9171_003496 [Xanthocarpia ochracea]